MSDTPITDAVQADLGKDHEDMVLHAETLERELAALRKERDAWKECAEHLEHCRDCAEGFCRDGAALIAAAESQQP